MAATSILPDPATTPIKIGRHARKTDSIVIHQLWLSGGNANADWCKGTPLARFPLFRAAALYRFTLNTREQADEVARDYHHHAVPKWEKDRREGKQGQALVEAEKLITKSLDGRDTVHLPLWLIAELHQTLGKQNIREWYGPAAFWFFACHINHDEAFAISAEVERRTAEHEAINREAHAALRSILTAPDVLPEPLEVKGASGKSFQIEPASLSSDDRVRLAPRCRSGASEVSG